jgi:transaldolase
LGARSLLAFFQFPFPGRGDWFDCAGDDTVPEATLQAFADHGRVRDLMPSDGGDCEEVLDRFRHAGIDIGALAEQLQREGAEAFNKSWSDLLDCIASKGDALKKAG